MFRTLKEKKETGFTLIELLIVMALLGVLVAVMLPKYQDLTPEAKLVASQQNLQTIRSAILIYAAKNQSSGGMPDSLGDLRTYFPRKKIPTEKISNLNTSELDPQVDDDDVTCTNSGGWIYNPLTGTVFVNVNDIVGGGFISNYSGSAVPFEW
ncbi:type II secretion system protein [Gemmatimonadota bacterium]